MKKKMICSVLGFLLIMGCKENDPMVVSSGFKVTIENVFQQKDYFSSGISSAIGPGESTTFSFHAGKGHHLSFLAMFAQSNDLFYSGTDSGLSLYDASGVPLSGDITSMFDLYDAGTEVNQEPGVGADQAPRQSTANTGTTENGTVKMIADVMDGFSYPADEAIINVNISHDGATMFTVTLKNISNINNFQTPIAPGVWVVHSEGQKPLFTVGQPASTDLEAVAEDGNNTPLNNLLMNASGYISPIAPGVFSVSKTSNPLFMISESSSSSLEALAEDGNPSGFTTLLEGDMDVVEYGIFNTPTTQSSPAPSFPGESYEFTFDARAGDYLSFATMLVQSNDLFIGMDKIMLFNGETPVSGDFTSSLMLFDAFTESNEYPGAGNNQAPRQGNANTGVTETGNISTVNDGFNYPAVSEMVKVTISPM